MRNALQKKENPSQLGFFLASRIFFLEILFALIKYLLILCKSSSYSFKLLIDQPSLQVCPYSYCEHKSFQKKVRVRSAVGFFTVATVTIIVSIVVNLFLIPVYHSQAATYTWAQTSWSGGATANKASHSSNQTGWTQYGSKDDNLAAATELAISTQTNSWTVTDNGSTDTGFNNSGASKSSVGVSGSGSAAGAVLSASNPVSWTKYASNPVINLGAGGSFDSSHAYVFSVILDGSTYKMWYDGNDGINNRVGYATSSDGITWTKSASSPVLNLGTSGAWDDVHVSHPSVILDGSTYKMWYAGYDGSLWKIGYATSSDGISWTKSVSNPVLSVEAGGTWDDAAIFTPRVIIDGSTYKMWYAGYDGLTWRIGYATSSDGITWNKYGSSAVFDLGSNGTWDDANLIQPHVILSGSTYKMWYAGNDGVSWRIGYATSSDGVTWARSGSNPVVDLGANGTWDDANTYDLAIAIDGTSYKMWYTGSDGTNNRIGYATANYESSGTFTSHVFDTTANISFGNLSWTATTPAGTSLTMKARSGNQSNLSDATAWGSCTNITSGQALSTGGCITDTHRYIQFQASFATTDVTATATLSDVTIQYTNYPTSQTLTSSSYNTSSSGNLLSRLSWTEDASLPAGATVQIQLRTAPDSSNSPGTWTSFQGPDGTSGTYFSNSGTGCTKASTTVTCTTIPSAFTSGSNDQWIGYKVYLGSSGANTPTFSDITLQYVVNAPPDFDTSFNTTGVAASQNSDGTVTVQYKIRDTDTASGTVTTGYITPSFQYSTNGGSSYSAITTTYLGGDDLNNKAVQEGTYTLYSATWNPKSQIGETYTTQAKVRVTINDNEAANNTANAASADFTLDTTNPVPGSPSISINPNSASPSSATIALSASDNSSMQMKVGLTADLSDASWETYATSKTVTLATDPDTVYAQFRDAYNNSSSIVSSVTPETPDAIMIQDTSNLRITPNENRLFVAWKVVATPAPGFKRYNVYRSTDNSSFSSVSTITNVNTNYYTDSSVVQDQTYYYRVSSQDNNDNISFFSDTIQARPDGIQNAGEGGGGSDEVAPTISSVGSSSVQTTSAVIAWTTNELSNSTVGFSTNNSFSAEQSVNSYVTSHSITLTGLTPNTAYYYQVKSTDPSSNLATDNNGGSGYTFTTSAGPAISNVAVKETDNGEATITWRTDTNSSTYVTYGTSVSGGSIVSSTEVGTSSLVGGSTPFTHSRTLSGLVSGTKYYFSVKSIDSGGNIAVDNNGGNFYQFTTTVDEDEPVISSVSVAMKNDTEAAVKWTTDEPATSQVKYATVSGGPYTLTLESTVMDTGHYVILTSLQQNTKYYYQVISEDINGNSGLSSEEQFTTKKDPSFQHDALAEISDISDPPEVVTDTKAVITFETDQAAQCSIEYGTQSGNYTEVPVTETGYNIDHAIHVSGLIFETKYYYAATCVDNLGTTAESIEYSFTTLEKQTTDDDNTPDITSVNTGSITGETAVITWKTDEDASSNVRYGITNEYGKMAGNDTVNTDTSDYTDSHSVTLTGLIPNTKYYYSAVSSDVAGNISKSAQDTFTTSSPSSLTSVKVASKTISKALVTWKTSKETSSIVEYGTSEEYGKKVESDDLTKEHELELVSLESGETYHFHVRGKDREGEMYASSDYTFAPKSPPVISDVDTEDITEHGVTVKFSTDIPTSSLVTYINEKDEKDSGTQGTPKVSLDHKIELLNLTPGATYAIKVAAVDTEGNQSEQSGPSFTTGKDENPPKIDKVKTDSALTQSDKVQTIISWVTDELSSTVLLYKEGRNAEEKELKISDLPATNHIAVVTIFKSGVVYYFRVRSTDESGNMTTSGEYALLTPKRKDNIVQVIITNFEDIFRWTKR